MPGLQRVECLGGEAMVDNALKEAPVGASVFRAIGHSEVARLAQPLPKTALRVLVLVPSEHGRPGPLARREAESISGLAGANGNDVVFNRQVTSGIGQIHAIFRSGPYDVIHFSGERTDDDISPECSFIHQHLTTIAADRLVHVLRSTPNSPKLVVFVSWLARHQADVLSRCAPFVINIDRSVGDTERVAFVQQFYKELFATRSVTGSFEHAMRMLRAEGLSLAAPSLHRPELTRKGTSRYIRCFPPADENGIVINMDAVAETIDDFGISREEVLHLIAWRTPIDRRLLNVSRDDALIPVGDVLLGSFSWRNREDVACDRLARLGAAPEERSSLWRTLLNSHNRLAASRYRGLRRPADPAFERELEAAIAAFEAVIGNDLLARSADLVALGFRQLLPHLARAETECAKASDRLLRGDYRGVVLALESALTHYHAVVSDIQPPVIWANSRTSMSAADQGIAAEFTRIGVPRE